MNALRSVVLWSVACAGLFGSAAPASAGVAYWVGDWQTSVTVPRMGSYDWDLQSSPADEVDTFQAIVDMPPPPDWDVRGYAAELYIRAERWFEVVGDSPAAVTSYIELSWTRADPPAGSYANIGFASYITDPGDHHLLVLATASDGSITDFEHNTQSDQATLALPVGRYRFAFLFDASVASLNPGFLFPPMLNGTAFGLISGVATVPEPSALLGLATGLALAGAAAHRRRRRTRRAIAGPPRA